jgi:uncharacterized protein
MTQHALTWFEISTVDIDRAASFYEQVLNTTLARQEMFGARLAVFPATPDGISGCLQQGPNNVVAPNQGAIVYLGTGDQLDAVLARVSKAGGKVAVPKTALPPGMGFFAQMIDGDGNRVGLHGTC